MSELLKWFEKRRETRALDDIQRHLSLTTGIIDYLERAVRAAIKNDVKGEKNCSESVVAGEREADVLRRKIMDDVAKGELSSMCREDLMHLVKRLDMVADYSREAIRILNAIPMDYVPTSIKDVSVEIAGSVKECVMALQKCVDKMMIKPGEALAAADAVEKAEEKVDDVYEDARVLLGKEDLEKPGVAVLIGQLFEAMEMIADQCEDACDQVRIIMVREDGCD